VVSRKPFANTRNGAVLRLWFASHLTSSLEGVLQSLGKIELFGWARYLNYTVLVLSPTSHAKHARKLHRTGPRLAPFAGKCALLTSSSFVCSPRFLCVARGNFVRQRLRCSTAGPRTRLEATTFMARSGGRKHIIVRLRVTITPNSLEEAQAEEANTFSQY
jgi:hypothetical protein